MRRVRAVVAAVVLLAQFVVYSQVASAPDAEAAPSIAQTYYTPFEAQQFIDLLRSEAGDVGCCSGSVVSTISITSGEAGNVVYYDHFEDGYEADPLNPTQASTLTLSLDAGAVWTQTSTIDIDPRAAGNHFDGRDKIVSTGAIAVTQAGYATTPGTVHAGAVQVLDVNKSGMRFDVPIGEDANHNEVFDYVGLVIVSTADNTTVDIDTDANGSFETQVVLDEGETHLHDGGVMLGAAVEADKPVGVYLGTGDEGASYEGRLFELYPTSIWSDEMVSPVGSQSSTDASRVFVFNPGLSAISVDVLTGGGTTATLSVPSRGQASYVMPVDEGARFSSQGGEVFYALEAITTEGTSTSAFDWGFTLIPRVAATPSVVVPYGPGSEGLTDNYNPVWVAADADTTLYVDLDGDPSTGTNTDPAGNQYDFSCTVGAYDSITVYDDGTTNCYLPSQDAGTGGDRDLTGARIYSLDGARLTAAWGQRPNYVAGLPALDMGTTILPFPQILLSKTSTLYTDADGDGLADGGDEIQYTITMENLGIVDVSGVFVLDETPEHTSYVAGSTTVDGTAQSDDPDGWSLSPLDADSPDGGLSVGVLPAGVTRTITVRFAVDSPIPFGADSIANQATMSNEYGVSSASDLRSLDVPPLQIMKESSASGGPVASGDTIRYTVRVFNGDGLGQTGIDVVDTLPPGVTYVSGSVAADIEGTPITAGPPPNLVTGATLASGDMMTITFDVTVDTPMAAGTTEFGNEASTSSIEYPTPVTDTAFDTAAPAADLSLSKSDDETAPLAPGDRLVYTLTVANAGPDEADDVVIVDTLPAGVTFVPAASDPSCAEAPAGTITCSVGDMGVTSASVVIAVDVDAGTTDGIITNSATVSSSTPDPTSGNEDASEGTAIDAPPTATVTKTAAPESVEEPGGTVTFSVSVANTSGEEITLVSLADDVFGDLLDAANPNVSVNTCDEQSATIPAGLTLSCSFDGFVAGFNGDPDHLDTVTAVVQDGTGNSVSEYDSATVSFADAAPTVAVTKAASAASIDEPGGPVTFDVTVSNTSGEDVTLSALVDDVYGDLLDGSNPNVTSNTCPTLPATLTPGPVFACSFDGVVAGSASDPDHVNTVTLEAADDEANTAADQASATVGLDDVAPSAAVTKTPSEGTITEPGGTVTFTIAITNSGVEALTLDALIDDVFGDLRDSGNAAIGANTCDETAPSIPADSTVECTFDADLSGLAGDPDHVDVVTATLRDDEGNVIEPFDDASVAFAPSNSTVSGIVFEDLDHDGVRDAGEQGIEGLDVVVTGSGGSPTTATTAGDGTWSAAVLPGSATVDVDDGTVPSGHVLTTANDPQTVSAVEGSDVPAGDVGYGPPTATLSGSVFLDLNGGDTMDPFEPGLEAVTVTLFDSGGTEVGSVETDAAGFYEFSGVVVGDFTIVVDGDDVGPGHQNTVDPDGTPDERTSLAVGSAAQVTGIDFGFAGTSAVGDTAWIDADEDGEIDDGEERLADAAVTLVWAGPDGIIGTADDVEFGTKISDARGSYLFEGVPAGLYRIEVDPSQVGTRVTPTTPAAITAELESGQAFLLANFGFAAEEELPFTGLDAQDLMVAAALLLGLGGIVLADGHKRNRKYEVELRRL